MNSLALPYSILWLEDSYDDVIIFSRKLKQSNLRAEVFQVENREEFLAAMDRGQWDVILADYNLPAFGPIDALNLLKERGLDIPFIVVSGLVSSEETIRLMRAGAKDIVPKNDVSRLVPAIDRELKERAIREDRRIARQALEERNDQLSEALEKLRSAQSDALRLQRIRAVGEMASGVAHDFNNTLMKASGLISVLGNDVGSGASIDSHSETIEALRSSIEDGKLIMQRVARFYNYNSDLEPDAVDLNRLIRVVCETPPEIHGRKDAYRKVMLKLDLGEIKPVLSKEADLQHAIENLVKNAIEAMPDGGTLRISTQASADNRVLLSIVDSGAGMTKAVLRRCLEPFFSTKGEFGTGLGLGLADAAVQQYGGVLSVESELGNGTNVSIVLRASTNAATDDTTPLRLETPEAVRRSLNVLVAEDEPLVGKLLVRFLQKDGHSADLTGSGKEALDRFESGHYDLVVSDRSMPGMTGDELALAIENQSPEIPFVLVTGFGDIMIARGEFPAGVDRILSKPVDAKSLSDAVREVTTSGPASPAPVELVR